MKREFEKKLLNMISRDMREILKDKNSITKNYYNCYNFLNDIINTIGDSVSECLLTELCIQKQYYKYRYLINKGLI